MILHKTYEVIKKYFAQDKIDIYLDDDVKVNYNNFKDILYPIKGLDKELDTKKFKFGDSEKWINLYEIVQLNF